MCGQDSSTPQTTLILVGGQRFEIFWKMYFVNLCYQFMHMLTSKSSFYLINQRSCPKTSHSHKLVYIIICSGLKITCSKQADKELYTMFLFSEKTFLRYVFNKSDIQQKIRFTHMAQLDQSSDLLFTKSRLYFFINLNVYRLSKSDE